MTDDDYTPYEEAQFGAVLPDDPEIKMRAGTHRAKLFDLMKGGEHWTPEELSRRTGIPLGSITARIRDLRKPQYGGHAVPKVMMPNRVWMYRLIPRAKR